MDSLAAFISLTSLIISCYILIRAYEAEGLAEGVLIFFLLLSAHIVLLGFILSAMNQLGQVGYWALVSLLTLLASIGITRWMKGADKFGGMLIAGLPSPSHIISSVKNWYIKGLTSFEKLILSPMLLTVFLLGILNLAMINFSAPHNWDSMTYHLARVGYYLQHNNLDYFDANYWAQVVHPKNSAILLIYAFLISGRNENLFQLVQFVAYWSAIASVYAISRKIGGSQTQGIFAAMVSALLVEWLMESTTPQNDLLLTAYFGVTTYFLFAFKEKPDTKYLMMTALGIGLSIGTKSSSFLPLFSIGIIAIYVLLKSSIGARKTLLKNTAFLVVFTLISVLFFALPSGYVDNYLRFGHPIGTSEIRSLHSFEGQSLNYIIRNGTKNLLRFGFEFLSLDGIPPIDFVVDVQSYIRYVPAKVIRMLDMDLENIAGTRDFFTINKAPVAHEDLSYWGILGFGLIWPGAFFILFRKGGQYADLKILAVAALLFVISQSYAGPYDPWRGRYFIVTAIFAVPVISMCIKTEKRLFRAYLLFIVLTGCVSAALAVAFRINSAPIVIDEQDGKKKLFFELTRAEQVSSNFAYLYEPLENYETLVPQQASVAVSFDIDSYEYPLFGRQITRRIIPINSFDKGLQPIPPDAEYLVYTVTGYPCPKPEDIFLGGDWYLRTLTENNRACP